MLQQIDQTRDAEARLLSRAYALILSWSEPDASNVQAETRDAELTREKSEVNDDDKK